MEDVTVEVDAESVVCNGMELWVCCGWPFLCECHVGVVEDVLYDLLVGFHVFARPA